MFYLSDDRGFALFLAIFRGPPIRDFWSHFDTKSAFLTVYLDQFEIRKFPTPPQTPPQIFVQEPLRPTGLREKTILPS